MGVRTDGIVIFRKELKGFDGNPIVGLVYQYSNGKYAPSLWAEVLKLFRTSDGRLVKSGLVRSEDCDVFLEAMQAARDFIKAKGGKI